MANATTSTIKGKLLGLDVGLARIGVSVSDPLGLAARPLTVLERRSRNEDFAELAQMTAGEEVEAIVCGLPLTMDGNEGEQAKTTRKWAKRLAYALRAILGKPYPIIFWDERLSTYAANEILASTHDSTTREDAAAAAVILQSYLDAERNERLVDYGRIDLPAKNQP